jgi:branched-chain amino acid transport system substrate-binding protein
MKKLVVAVALGLAVVAAFFALQKSDTSESMIRIGAILPLSGEGAGYGEAAKKGMELAVEQINASGGVGGTSIQIIYEDTQGDPKTGVAAFQKLVTVDKVQAVVGDLLSSVTLSVAPIANSRKVVLLSPSSSSPKITTAGDYIFRNCPSDVYEGTIMAKFAVEKRGLRDIAILRINNEYGLGIASVFKDVVTASGGKIVGEEVYDENSTDFRTQITKIAQTRPSAVYLLGYKQMGYVLRQARELGLSTQFLSTVTFEDPEILALAGDAAEGVIFSASTFDVASENAVVSGFVSAFQSKYQSAPDIFAGLSYDAVKILALGLTAGGTSGEGIKNALYQVQAYAGVVGEVSMDVNGDAILTPVIKTVQGGKFVFLE